jgi:hypothetical protein
MVRSDAKAIDRREVMRLRAARNIDVKRKTPDNPIPAPDALSWSISSQWIGNPRTQAERYPSSKNVVTAPSVAKPPLNAHQARSDYTLPRERARHSQPS